MIDARAELVACVPGWLTVRFTDERILTVPMHWFPVLAAAPPEELDAWRITHDGAVISWPRLGFHLRAAVLLTGPVPVANPLPTLSQHLC